MTTEIGWYDAVPLPVAMKILGLKEIPADMTKGKALARAAGMWTANEREMYAAYMALATHLSH